MNPVSLKDKYSLLELIEDAEAEMYVAAEIPTGKRVVVCLFAGEQIREQKDILLQLGSVDRLQFPELIDIGDDGGTPYVVLQSIGGFSELKARLSRIQPAPPILPDSKPAEPSNADAGCVPNAPGSASGETSKIAAGPQAGQPSVETSRTGTPGSFTQMFQAASPPVDEPAPEISGAKPPLRQKAEPGSFTQMFEAASQPIGEPALNAPKDSSPISGAPRSARSAPGEFTQFFSASFTTKQEPEPRKGESREEFERLFGRSGNAGTPPASATGMFHPPPPPAAPDPAPRTHGPQTGEFTRMFGKAATGEDQPPGSVEQIPERSKDSPGEYTRIFGVQPFLQEPGAAPAHIPPDTAPAHIPSDASESAVPATRHSLLIPVLIGAILFLLAALAIVIFATLKR